MNEPNVVVGEERLRVEIIRAVAGLDGYENPNTAKDGWWDKRVAPVRQAVLAALPQPATEPALRPAERFAAEAILDRANADPDDDAAIVARAALRLAAQPPAEVERLRALIDAIEGLTKHYAPEDSGGEEAWIEWADLRSVLDAYREAVR